MLLLHQECVYVSGVCRLCLHIISTTHLHDLAVGIGGTSAAKWS